MKRNSVLLPMGAVGETAMTFAAKGARVDICPFGEDASWRNDAEPVFRLDQGLTIGYRGFYDCGQA